MVWTKLFRFSFEDSLKRSKVNNFTRSPSITGIEKRKVIKLFEQLKVPFIYSYREYYNKFNNFKSPYHKLPKGIAIREKYYYDRLKKVRAALALGSEKEIKIRQEVLNKRKYGGINDMLKKIYPFLMKPTNERKEGTGDLPLAGKRNKMISEHVKGVPKMGKDVKRKEKEMIKYQVEQGLTDYNSIVKDQQKSKEMSKNTRKKEYYEKLGVDSNIEAILSGKKKVGAKKDENEQGTEKIEEKKKDLSNAKKNEKSPSKNEKKK